MNDDSYWLGFSAFPGIGPSRFETLLHRFGNAKSAWSASEEDLIAVIGKAVTAKFIAFRSGFARSAYEKKLIDKKISFLLKKNTDYPRLLSDTPTAPFVLYCKGNAALVSEQARTIAIVGTRKMTDYGAEVTTLLTQQLVAHGFTIISGLALGVDAIAHQVTLAEGGKTIAVLGCGVDCCSPSANQPLYDKIMGHFGAIVSESAFEAAILKGMFPARNRIIAGLAQAVLVTEGAEDSGSLITAERALALGRPVFAVPGPITSTYSKGPIALLHKGAQVVQGVEDILKQFDMDVSSIQEKKQKIHSDIPEEQEIIVLLEKGPLYPDELVRMLGKTSATIGSSLSMMEMKGLVKNKGGKLSIN